MATFFGPPLPDPLAQGVKGAFQSIGDAIMHQAMQQQQAKMFGQDIQAIQGYQQGQLAPGVQGPAMPAPQLQTPMGQQMFAQQMMQPISPLTQEEQRQAALVDAGLAPKATQPGYQVVQDAQGQFMLMPKSPGVDPVGMGVMGSPKQPLVNITNVPEGSGLPIEKSTKTQAEKNIISAEETLTGFKWLEDNYNPMYLKSLPGDVKQKITGFTEYLGMEPSKALRDFVTKRAEFRAQSKQIFLKYRKHITGVAGGIKEFQEIAKAMPDAEKDTPSVYEGKKRAAERANKLVMEISQEIRGNGLPVTKENFKRFWRQRYKTAKEGNAVLYESQATQEANPIDPYSLSNEDARRILKEKHNMTDDEIDLAMRGQ